MGNKKQQKLVLGLVIVLILVVFALLNTEPTAINFGITSIKIPLILLIVILILIGAVIAFLMGHESKHAISPDEMQTKLEEQATELNEAHEQVVTSLKDELSKKDDKIKELENKLDANQVLLDGPDSENK